MTANSSSSPSPITPATGWNVETALLHVLSVIELHDRRYEQRFESQGDAVKKAEAATEKRFEGVNEFRLQLGDQQRMFIPRTEVISLVEGVVSRLQATEKALSDKITIAQDELSSLRAERIGIKGGWGYAVGVAGFIALLVGAALAAFK